MQYSTRQIGITGPSQYIGGSDDYHIDSRFGSHLPMTTVRDKFDALANRYSQDGRIIEFSNKGVSGRQYSMDLSPEERLQLLELAAAAHDKRDGWHSFDYYAPHKGSDRWDPSAEGAPIYIIGTDGNSFETGTGGGYGNYAVVLDDKGNIISKSGHGDNRETLPEFGKFGPGESLPLSSDTPQTEAKERVQSYLGMSKDSINAAYDKMRSEDPSKAAIEGLKMHKAYFGK